jgi:uncharacterized RDD family membrane protein YckC
MTAINATTAPATPEDIARQSKLVPHLLLRWAGAWTDLIVLMAFLVVPDFLLGNETYRATMLFWLGAAALYFPIAEGLWGRTVGKLLTGMIVVDKAGNAPGIGRAAVRTILRLVEVNPVLVGGLPAGIAVALSKNRQRLGDMLAQTYVVRVKALEKAKGSPIAVERAETHASSAMVLKIGPVTLLPAVGMTIEPRLLGSRGAGRGKGPIADIMADLDDPSALALRNLSHQPYRATLPDGRTVDLLHEDRVRLLPGTVIDFGGIEGALQRA